MCNRMRVISVTAIPLHSLHSHSFFYLFIPNPAHKTQVALSLRNHKVGSTRLRESQDTENFSPGATAGDSARDVEDLGFGNFRDENTFLNLKSPPSRTSITNVHLRKFSNLKLPLERESYNTPLGQIELTSKSYSSDRFV